jgi:hypothetical protein
MAGTRPRLCGSRLDTPGTSLDKPRVTNLRVHAGMEHGRIC